MVTDVSSKITAVRWKDNNVVNVISTITGKQLIQQVKRFCHLEKWIVKIEQPNIINQYNMSTEGDDCMDQNISAYMINLQRNGAGHVFDLLLMWPSVMLTKYIASPIYILENIDWMPLAFTKPLQMHTTCHLYRNSLLSTTLFTGSRSLPLCKQFAV